MPIVSKVIRGTKGLKEGTVLVTIPSVEVEEIVGEYTRWGKTTGDYALVHEGTHVVIKETADEVWLADLLGSGFPSAKHGHVVRKADIYGSEVSHE